VTYNEEKRVAVEAVTQAAALCRAVQLEMTSVEALEKDDRSPVTIADLGSQALICHRLAERFPNDVIVAEEDAGDLRQPENNLQLAQVTQYVSRFQLGTTPERVCAWIDRGNGRVAERFWTLDPIDGTKGFLRDDQYAIALALIEGGKVKIGVLACPVLPLDADDVESPLGTVFIAVDGEGTVRLPLDGRGEPVPIHVAQEADTTRWRFVESVEAAHGNAALQEAVARAVRISHPPLKMDSQVKYAAVARGEAVLYLRLPSPKYPDYREKIWDHAAGSLIVEQAGGKVTDMFGRPLDLASHERMRYNRGVVVSNGSLHADVIAALEEARSAYEE
jgi:3'(2'), 5'-bisphosphate nucleotidase